MVLSKKSLVQKWMKYSRLRMKKSVSLRQAVREEYILNRLNDWEIKMSNFGSKPTIRDQSRRDRLLSSLDLNILQLEPSRSEQLPFSVEPSPNHCCHSLGRIRNIPEGYDPLIYEHQDQDTCDRLLLDAQEGGTRKLAFFISTTMRCKCIPPERRGDFPRQGYLTSGRRNPHGCTRLKDCLRTWRNAERRALHSTGRSPGKNPDITCQTPLES